MKTVSEVARRYPDTILRCSEVITFFRLGFVWVDFFKNIGFGAYGHTPENPMKKDVNKKIAK